MKTSEPQGTYGKDAYYFPHDSNAKDDPKCIQLIESLGLEGYGIYWVLLEILRDQPEYKYPISALAGIARRYNTTHDKVTAVVKNSGLFQIENDLFFFSASFTRRMALIDGRRRKQSDFGILGNKVRWGKIETTDNQLLISGSDRVAIASQSQRKERKEKERKEKEIKKEDILSSKKSLASEFWLKEIDKNKNEKEVSRYETLFNYLKKNKADHLFALRDQLSFKEFVGCMEFFQENKIRMHDTIDDMINAVGAFPTKGDKKKVSFNLTLQSWGRMRLNRLKAKN